MDFRIGISLDAAFQLLVSAGMAVAVFSLVATLAALMTWGERKLASMIQDRIGPNRANLMEFIAIFSPLKLLQPLFKDRFTAWGLFHILADPTKVFFKEDFIPAGANKVLHTLAPMISLFIPFVVFSVIPFAGPFHIQWRDIPAEELWLIGRFFPGDTLHLSDYTIKFVVADLDVGMLFLFAVASLAVYGMILAGFSSNNKFSFLGAVRGANQMISYEVALGLTAVGLFMIYGGVSVNTLVAKQGELVWNVLPKWGILTQPLAFILFLLCGIAEIKKIPFDLPEGESEIIAGYFLEYSSLKFTSFLFAEYVEMILLSATMTTLFFGGWQVPWISAEGYHFLSWQGSWEGTWLASVLTVNGVRLLIVLLQGAKFFLFLAGGIYFLFMVRWTFPRFRYDQLMRLGWKMVLPLALLNILGTGLALLLIRGWW